MLADFTHLQAGFVTVAVVAIAIVTVLSFLLGFRK